MDSVYVMLVESTYVKKSIRNETIDLWHMRLGHINYHKLSMIMKRLILKGLPQLDVKTNTINARCQYDKAHQLPYEESKFKLEEQLELIHSDVFGAIKHTSIGRRWHMVMFIDDYSMYVWIFLKKNLIHSLSLKSLKKLLKEKREKRLYVCLRTNNRGEYTSNEFYLCL